MPYGLPMFARPILADGGGHVKTVTEGNPGPSWGWLRNLPISINADHRLTQTYLARCPRGQPPPAPLPSPTARPNKGVLTICSSGCAAFGHPASPPKDRSPTRDGRECRGQIWFAASHGCGAHGPSKPMFLWTPPVLWAAHAARNGGAA